jgi:hypothetical protein
MSNLWNLQFGGTASLPILTRGDSRLSDSTTDMKDLTNFGIYGDQSAQIKDPINVVLDFPWTNSPKASREDVPKLQMIEQRIVLNSTVSNMIYSTLATADNVSALGNTAAGLGTRIGGFFSDDTAASTDSAAAQEEVIVNEEEKSNKSALKDAFNSVLAGGFFKTFNSDVLKPYDALYATEYTGFNYYFPYLEDSYREITNQFGDGDANALGPIAELASSAANFSNILNVVKPGTYIEKSKQYTMGSTGRDLTFTVPLLNTGTFDDVRRNWQLIFGIVYQNRPGRVSKSIIDQPVIYEIHLPGVAYMPYAFISNLSVKFLGNRREMELDVPIMNEGTSGGVANNIGKIRTVIPDAYELSITVSGLNEETRNFIYASVKKDKLTVNKPV